MRSRRKLAEQMQEISLVRCGAILSLVWLQSQVVRADLLMVGVAGLEQVGLEQVARLLRRLPLQVALVAVAVAAAGGKFLREADSTKQRSLKRANRKPTELVKRPTTHHRIRAMPMFRPTTRS